MVVVAGNTDGRVSRNDNSNYNDNNDDDDESVH